MVELRKRPVPTEASNTAVPVRPAKAQRGAGAGAGATAKAAVTAKEKAKGNAKKGKGGAGAGKQTKKVSNKKEEEEQREEDEEGKDEGEEEAAAKENDQATTAAADRAKTTGGDGDNEDGNKQSAPPADKPAKLGPELIGQKIGELSKTEGDFGGTVTTHEGESVKLKDLVLKSKRGIAIFTYPRASTPGCTTQACLFRDSYDAVTKAGLSVYGLSTDSEKANTTFATKQKLSYPLLCDPKATLTGAIGMAKGGKSTSRGVVVIDRNAFLRVWLQAGPQKTLDAVLEYIDNTPEDDEEAGVDEAGAIKEPEADAAKAPEKTTELADPDVQMDEVPLAKTPTNEEREAAQTAAEVGEVAAKLDGEDKGEGEGETAA